MTDNISTSQIEQDIAVTLSEIADSNKKIEVMQMHIDALRIGIESREGFVAKLQNILIERKQT